jgi:type IV pilus assembly protein PilP
MRINTIFYMVPVSLCLLVAGCSSDGYTDIDEFMAETKARPAGHIKPIPPFQTFKSFTYGASGLRSPFEKPIDVKDITIIQMRSDVKPDENRTKEYLEQFSLDSLTMVGTLEQSGTLWALMLDQEGSVHRVTQGNYIGRNNGRIVETTESYVSVVEIVSNGVDGWVERPRTIKLKTVD